MLLQGETVELQAEFGTNWYKSCFEI